MDEPRRTGRQRAGDDAEELTVRMLEAMGWRTLARNVHAGRSELDIVAVDPGPPARLAVVEVRWRRSRAFGTPEETLNREKREHLRRGLGRLLETGLPGGEPLPALPVAIDLAVVEPGPDGPRIRLLRDALL